MLKKTFRKYFKKRIKKLSKELVLAIEWVAAEYKYLEELRTDLQELEKQKDSNKKLLHKAAKIIRYLGKAERRAARYEDSSRIKLEDLSEELSKHLEDDFALKDIVLSLRAIAKEIDIEHADLVEAADIFHGKLQMEFRRAEAEDQLGNELRKKGLHGKVKETHTAFLQLIRQMEEQVDDAEMWINALQTSLKKAKKLLEKLSSKEKMLIVAEGTNFLRKQRFPMYQHPELTNFLAHHPSDLRELEISVGHKDFFPRYLPALHTIINETTWPTLVKILHYFFNQDSYNEGVLERLLKLGKDVSPENVATALKDAEHSAACKYFNAQEVINFFLFMENCVKIIKEKKISIVYAVDRSGRILGFLLNEVLKHLGLSRNVKCYFIHGTMLEKTTMYSERQKKELWGKSILVIDEYVSSGATLRGVKKFLEQFVPEEKITLSSFSSIIGHYFSVQGDLPSWYYKKEYSGVDEKEHGGVEVNKYAGRMARKVRRSLAKLSRVIAKYLKEKGY